MSSVLCPRMERGPGVGNLLLLCSDTQHKPQFVCVTPGPRTSPDQRMQRDETSCRYAEQYSGNGVEYFSKCNYFLTASVNRWKELKTPQTDPRHIIWVSYTYVHLCSAQLNHIFVKIHFIWRYLPMQQTKMWFVSSFTCSFQKKKSGLGSEWK